MRHEQILCFQTKDRIGRVAEFDYMFNISKMAYTKWSRKTVCHELISTLLQYPAILGKTLGIIIYVSLWLTVITVTVYIVLD